MEQATPLERALAARERYSRRKEVLDALIEKHGIASECELYKLELRREPARFALMEADDGPADNGGPWWRVDDDWRDLLVESAEQVEPGWWPAKTLYDLDTGREWDVQLAYRLLDQDAKEADQ